MEPRAEIEANNNSDNNDAFTGGGKDEKIPILKEEGENDINLVKNNKAFDEKDEHKDGESSDDVFEVIDDHEISDVQEKSIGVYDKALGNFFA